MYVGPQIWDKFALLAAGKLDFLVIDLNTEVFEPKLEADRKREIISKTFRVPDGVDSSSHNTSLWMKRSVHSKMK